MDDNKPRAEQEGRRKMAYFNTHSMVASRSQEMNDDGISIEQLLDQIAKALVDRPDDVSVNTLNAHQTIVFELRVAKDDLGKVIGKHGRTAQALRTLLAAVSAKQKKRTVLEIIE